MVRSPVGEKMLTFLRYNYILRNISLFVNYIEGTEVHSDKLRNSYFRCLNKVQKHRFRFNDKSKEIFLDFNQRDMITQETLKYVSEIPNLTEEHEFTKDEMNAIKHNIKLSLALLCKYNSTSSVVPLLIGSFVFAKNKQVGAASRSDCLGVIFLNPQPHWLIQDYAECILHEMVHQSIFLDDMINGIYTRTLWETGVENALITSAIRKTKRPYDLSFHSACVSAVIIDFYTRLGISKKVDAVYPTLQITLKELKVNEKFLAERGKNILVEITRFLSCNPYLTKDKRITVSSK